NAYAKKLSSTGLHGDWQHTASGEIFYARTITCTIPYNTTLEGEFTRYTSADRCKIYYDDDFYPSKIVDSGTTITPRLRLDWRPNYQYIGTYTNQGLTDEFDFNTPITTTTRLYEKFEGYGHRIVVYITNGGTQVETIYAHSDVQFDAPTPPTKDNFTFVGWTDSYGGSEIYDFNSEPPDYFSSYINSLFDYGITILFAVWDDGSTPPTPGPEPVTPTLESISISVPPSKLNYEVGEKFNPAGLKITRNYTGGTSTVLTYNDTTKNNFSFNPSLTTALTEADTYVTITYGGKSVRQNITVTVSKVVASISIISRPTKVNYTVGNYLRPAGLKIRVHYEDNTTEDIKYSSSNASLFTFNPTLRTRLAVTNNQVAVTYKGKTATFSITVTRSGGGYTPSGGSGSRGGSSGSSATVGPMGDLTKNPAYAYLFENQTYTFNNLSATNLLSNNALAITLLSDPENANRANTNVVDINGNTGFGKWQKAPGTTIWYFLSGDIAANGTKGSVGFISNGWYNLEWNGNTGWYHFDAVGVMQVGWYEENGKRYYFNTNPQDANYGKSVTGTANINGTIYNFDVNGALIS
ncbi:MAG: bacterial Ig-like domain-containing protein, partial [Lachnospiraceae bacterium]|nr:bacterial Ig-like domain-containing protein [Lachnospiraceae bacterium]